MRVHLGAALCATVSLCLIVAAISSGRASSVTSVAFGPDINLNAGSLSMARNQREPTLAVNPMNPRNAATVYYDVSLPKDLRICRSSYTVDGGTTWNQGGNASNDGNGCGDPALGADALGTFYLSYLFLPVLPGGFVGNDGINVAKSTDGGRTFPTFSTAVPASSAFVDKDYIAVDAQPGSPFEGTIYVTYTEFSVDPVTAAVLVQNEVVVSRDGGETWSSPIALAPAVDNPEQVEFSMPAVAPDGTAYVVYARFNFLIMGSLSIDFVKSADGGRTWSAPAAVASNLPSPGYFELKNADPMFGVMPFHGITAATIPVVAIGPPATIYVAWTDFPRGSCLNLSGDFQCTNSDVRLSLSKNGGKSWTAPVKVSDERNASDQFMPWIAVHPSGLLSLMWSDKRLDPENEDYDIFYTNTPDGTTFLPNVRVTTESSDIGQASFIGDYNNLGAAPDRVYAVWSDLRAQTNLNIFAATGLLG